MTGDSSKTGVPSNYQRILMNFSGLSLDQAPPIYVPFSFFITASILGIFGSLHIALFDYNYVYFHLISIGFVGFVIIGALFQMFPVMIGVSVKKVLPTFYTIFFSLLLGLICFYLGYTLDNHTFMVLSTLLLISGFLTFCTVFLYSLFTSSTHHDATSIAMSISLIFLTLGTLFGASILLQYYLPSTIYHLPTNIHINTIFFGTIFILIMGISFKIIPMFWVAKNYPTYCKKFILPLTTTLVLGFIILKLFDIDFNENIFYALIALPLMAFYSITIRRLKNRKRKLKDYSVYFLYLGLSLGFIASISLILQLFIPIDKTIFGLLFGFGCVLSFIFGLLYKIVPFLCWFHLSAKGLFDIPTIKDFIKEKTIKLHFYLHIILTCGIFLYIVDVVVINILLAVLFLEFIVLLYNISSAFKTYLSITQKVIQ